MKEEFSGGEQGVHSFLLLWPFWNILSGLAGMVSLNEKEIITVSLEEALLKYLKSYLGFLVKCLKCEACFFAQKISEMSLSVSQYRNKEQKLEEKIAEN